MLLSWEVKNSSTTRSKQNRCVSVGRYTSSVAGVFDLSSCFPSPGTLEVCELAPYTPILILNLNCAVRKKVIHLLCVALTWKVGQHLCPSLHALLNASENGRLQQIIMEFFRTLSVLMQCLPPRWRYQQQASLLLFKITNVGCSVCNSNVIQLATLIAGLTKLQWYSTGFSPVFNCVLVQSEIVSCLNWRCNSHRASLSHCVSSVDTTHGYVSK